MNVCDECGKATQRTLVTARNIANPAEGNLRVCYDCAVNLGIGWFDSLVKCNICGNEWEHRYPAYADEGAIECPRCATANSIIVKRL